MSQRRHKKELSVLDNVSSLTDPELREALKEYGQSPGPITDSTRTLYRKKLVSLIGGETSEVASSTPRQSPAPKVSKITILSNLDDEDSETSDEDFVVDEEDLDDDDESEASGESVEDVDDDDDDVDDDDNESSSEDLLDELEGDTSKLSEKEFIKANLSSSTSSATDVSPNRISLGILITLISFFIAIFSYYLYSTNNLRLLVPSQPLKNMTKQLLIVLALSPLGYFFYKVFSHVQLCRRQDNQKVNDLVDEALELLQSPDNPRGQMPVLHIRDTLLTPAERKSKRMINLWNKTVKFVEDHESRVRVEIVNIDGEDFRAWKWIGSRKA